MYLTLMSHQILPNGYPLYLKKRLLAPIFFSCTRFCKMTIFNLRYTAYLRNWDICNKLNATSASDPLFQFSGRRCFQNCTHPRSKSTTFELTSVDNSTCCDCMLSLKRLNQLMTTKIRWFRRSILRFKLRLAYRFQTVLSMVHHLHEIFLQCFVEHHLWSLLLES